MTARIREFLKHRKDDGPCLVVDLDVVRENYLSFARSLPDSKVFYAVKANPAPDILKLLAELGACFDVASVAETQAALAAGALPERISYGNTIKKESEIAAAHALGVTLYAVDCEAEVEKVARAAPGARVICRIHCDGSGSEWPLSRKFGCEPDYAADILELAHRRGLVPHGVSFHVGSQQHNVEAWDRALGSTAAIFRSCAERGITLSMVNLGGGFPARYVRKTPRLESYGKAIFRSLRRHFGNDLPDTIVEPGRGLVPHGVSFHVGSQQHNIEAWDRALASTAAIFRACAERGIVLAMVNLGGGFPARYVRKTPKLESYGKAIFKALRKHFGNNLPNTIVEPGRGLVGNAGVIEAEVVLIAKRSPEDEVRWVYLDIGKFHGLAETIGESIRYPIRTTHDRDETAPCIIAGPTCDSVDVLYEKTPYPLPVSLAIGDKVLIEATGAYTATYSSVGFNGYPPLRQYVI